MQQVTAKRKMFQATKDISIRAFAPDDRGDYVALVVFEDPDYRVIPVFANELGAVIKALVDAAIWLTNPTLEAE